MTRQAGRGKGSDAPVGIQPRIKGVRIRMAQFERVDIGIGKEEADGVNVISLIRRLGI